MMDIEEYLENQNYWNKVPWDKELSQDDIEDFMREFQNKVDWDFISREQGLSENFIREFQDRVNWFIISLFQKLSRKFIVEFSDKLDFQAIIKNNNLSDDVKQFCRMFL